MKKIIALVLDIILFSGIVSAQDSIRLSHKMELFKEYCIRVSNAAAQCDVDELIDCISQWEPASKPMDEYERFRYRNILLKCKTLEMMDNDITGDTSVLGHNLFMPQYVDSLIVNKCEPMEIMPPELLRGVGDLLYAIRAVKKRSKVSYTVYDCGGNVEIFVVAEKGGMINLYVTDEETSHTYSDVTPTGRSYAQLKWNMPLSGDITVTIENVSDIPISFIIVRN